MQNMLLATLFNVQLLRCDGPDYPPLHMHLRLRVSHALHACWCTHPDSEAHERAA